jgi:hypothetical protein
LILDGSVRTLGFASAALKAELGVLSVGTRVALASDPGVTKTIGKILR